MWFAVTMRDGQSIEVDGSYLEVANGPANSSYTIVGPVPGYPVAILAVFPVDEVAAVTPMPGAYSQASRQVARSMASAGPHATRRVG